MKKLMFAAIACAMGLSLFEKDISGETHFG